MTVESLSLGPLSLLASQSGPLLTIAIHAPSDTAPVGRMTLTVAEWTSLVALVDCMGAAEMRIAELTMERDALIASMYSAPFDRALVVEVCHDLINRAMRNESDEIPDRRSSKHDRDKEAAIRALIADRDSLRQQLAAANEHAVSMVVAYNRELSRAQVAEYDRDSLRQQVRELTEERDTLRDHLRVSEEQNEALGDANVLAVKVRELTEENERLKARDEEQGCVHMPWCDDPGMDNHDPACPANAGTLRAQVENMLPIYRAAIEYCEGDGNMDDVFDAVEARSRGLMFDSADRRPDGALTAERDRLRSDLSAALVSVDAMAERLKVIAPVYAETALWRQRYPETTSAVCPRTVLDAIDTALAHTASEQGKDPVQ